MKWKVKINDLKTFLKPDLSKIIFFVFGVWIGIIYFACVIIHALFYGPLSLVYPMETCFALILWPALLVRNIPGPSNLILGLMIIAVGFYWYVLTCLFDQIVYKKFRNKFKKKK